MPNAEKVEKQVPALLPGIPMERPNGEHPEVSDVSKKLYFDTLPSTVRVATEKSVGSGFYIDDKGTIATDAHVVLNNKEHFSLDKDGKLHRLRIDKIDDLHDLAILKPVEPVTSPTQPLNLGSSKDLRFGDPVFAIGNPKGVSSVYVSPGRFFGHSTPLDAIAIADPDEADKIATKLGKINDRDYDEFYLRSVIGARIHVEHGNSGGPVLDKSGKVIGLTDLGSPSDGVGYMTPVEQLIALQKAPQQFRINYEYQPASWAKSYTDLWSDKPLKALEVTGLSGAVGVVGLAALRRYSLLGGGFVTGNAAFRLVEDYSSFSAYQDGRDSLKYGVAMAADATTLAGGIALMSLRKKSYGLSTVAVGIAGRLGAEFIPNRLVNTGIERLDGSKKPLMGTIDAESIFDPQAFGIK